MFFFQTCFLEMLPSGIKTFCSQRSQMTVSEIHLQPESAQVLSHVGADRPFCLLNYRLLSVFLSTLERRVDSNDRVYFVNHNTKTTQWEDPRTQG